MFRTLAISSFLLAGTASVANADVYRWVDDHGGVHYSDQWVPGSQVIKSNRPHPSMSSAPAETASRVAESQKSANASAPAVDPNVAKAVKQDMAKIREQQCKEAKDRYEKAIQARRIYKAKEGDTSKNTDRPDDRQYLSDEEADAYRMKARQDVQDLCGSSAK